MFVLFLIQKIYMSLFFFFFQAEDGIRAADVTGVQTCALPISCGTIIAAPAPWIVRKTITISLVGDRPQARGAAVKIARPARNIRRYPISAPRRAPVIS